MIKFLTSLIWILNHPNNRNKVLHTLFRIVWWKINQLMFKFPVVVELMKGIKYIAYPDSSFGGLVVYTRLPEYHEMNYFYGLIDSADVVIDVGVHMGDYSLLAASKITSGKVLSFEPSKEALRVFRENILINKYENRIEVYPVVASDKQGSVSFVDSNISEVSHISFSLNSTKNKNEVKSLPVDSIIQSQGISKIKVIKIDVEGAELLVLRGLEKSLTKHLIKNIIVEVNSDCINYGYAPTDTFEYLKKFGYKLYFFDKQGKLKNLMSFPLNKKYVNIIAKL